MCFEKENACCYRSCETDGGNQRFCHALGHHGQAHDDAPHVHSLRKNEYEALHDANDRRLHHGYGRKHGEHEPSAERGWEAGGIKHLPAERLESFLESKSSRKSP